MNSINRVNRINFLLFALCSLLIFVIGCASVQKYIESSETSHGQITVFLKGPDKTSLDITFDLEAVNIMAEDGTYREIMNTPMNINSVSITDRQMLLSERIIPIGRYKKLQLIVKQALIKRKDRTANLALPPEGIYVDIDITIQRNQNTSLFLTWNPDLSIAEEYLFKPAFTVKGQVPELSALLIYVTNEDSNNVSVINRQSGDVVATIMVGKRPRGIAVSLGKEHPRVYVANSGSNSISVIDPTTNKVEIEIPIRFGTEPEGIAVARISPEKELIFVTNYGSNNVSVIDVSTYQEIDKINVGDGPIAVAIDPPLESLSSAKFLSFDDINSLRSYREDSFNVYVVNKNSKNVSVVKIYVAEGRCKGVIDVPVEWNPIALSVDYQRGKIYVANYNFDNLSVIDIPQLVNIIRNTEPMSCVSRTVSSVSTEVMNVVSRTVSAITNVGISVIGVLPDPDLDRLYLLKDVPGQIVIIRPFSEAFGSLRTTVAPILGTITVGNSPRSLILDPEARKIYVVNRGSDTVSEIDKTTKREERVIPVGRRPYGITVFPL
jgi:YVTN family beta-propeller protein